MAKTLKIAPPNSLIFISDASGGVGPEFVPNRLVLSTDSVISVGCLASMDGETKITLGPASEVGPSGLPAFDGLLETPSGKIVISTVEDDNILEADVPSVRTGIRIWANHPVEPDDIVVAWGN
jgi:hypothetical protein